MTKQELIERYVYAVGRNLPYKIREDVKKEITAIIYDMLEERCPELPGTEKDVRVILAELGRPEELAQGYQPDKDSCLIGPPYYIRYKRITRIILAAVLFGMLIAGGMSLFLEALETPVEPLKMAGEITGWLWSIALAEITVFGGVTLAFACLQRKGIVLEDINGSNWEHYAVPKKKKNKGKGENIAEIIFTIVFLVIFLFAPGIIGGVFTVDGKNRYIPMLDPEAVRQAWYLIIIFSICGITREVYRLLEEHDTYRKLLITGILDFLSAAGAVIWLTCYELISPAFLEQVKLQLREDVIAVRLFEHFQMFFMGIVLIALLLDFGTAVYRTVKYTHTNTI